MAKKKVDFKGLTIEEISNIIEKGLRIRSLLSFSLPFLIPPIIY